MKALSLFSGGLDSLLTVKLIQLQGIKVEGITFSSAFFGNEKAIEGAKQLGIKLHIVKLGKAYVSIIRRPKFGYGSAMNPCIDCKIFMLKEAKKYAKKIGAKFIFTGEVLDQRPKSQYHKALMIIAKEAGLENKMLRPLSAKLLPETEAEKKCWVDRNKLLGIKGRKREEQMKLAEKFKLKYPSPAGGCLLCEKEFAVKLKDLFAHKNKTSSEEITLLKIGRHFRIGENKVVVGRNKEENEKLLKLKGKNDYFFEVPKIGSPTTILQGKKAENAIKLVASLTVRYSDSKEKEVLVRYGKGKLNKEIKVKQLTEEEIRSFRL
jgi:tRNA U34 2-thiouridine synthase MnmA/TrmU